MMISVTPSDLLIMGLCQDIFPQCTVAHPALVPVAGLATLWHRLQL